MNIRRFKNAPVLAVALLCLAGCGTATVNERPERTPTTRGEEPLRSFSVVSGIALGEPLAVSLDYDGNPIVADGAPGRVLRIRKSGDAAIEFDQPRGNPGFYPTDLDLDGFFVYALDRVGRVLVRFDKNGAYRDVMINFESQFLGQRVTPVGLDVDGSGRIAVTDTRNHQIILFDSYLVVELVFGSYGSAPGRLHAPEGVAFGREGDLVVADTGNRRIQVFDAVGKFIRTIPAEGGENPLMSPRRAFVAEDGKVFVADPEAGKVFVFDPDGRAVRSIVPAGAPEFRPTDVAVDRDGLVYVTDLAASSLLVFR